MRATACGSGKARGPASREATYQAAIMRASERSRSAMSFPRPVERPWIKLARRPGELGAADLGQHAVERARVGLLLVDRSAKDAFAVALAIEGERAGFAHANAGRKLLPFGLGGGEKTLGFARGLEKTIDRGFVAGAPRAVEGIADDRDRSPGAELPHYARDLDRAPEAVAFKVGAEVPERERRVLLALQRLLREKRWRAVDNRRLAPQVETGAAREPLKQEPALVERAAGDRELFALQVGDARDRRVRRHHHGAEGR